MPVTEHKGDLIPPNPQESTVFDDSNGAKYVSVYVIIDSFLTPFVCSSIRISLRVRQYQWQCRGEEGSVTIQNERCPMRKILTKSCCCSEERDQMQMRRGIGTAKRWNGGIAKKGEAE